MWGIIGLGKIANKFAADLQYSETAQLYGVASQDLNKAKKFSTKYNAQKYYGSYQALANAPEIDIIYVATPHVFHFENTMMCLKQNKAVLCEKPMGMNAKEVRLMIEEASTRNLFLMEGLWTRFIPATEKLIELLAQNVIGQVTSLQADFGFKGDSNPENRIFNKNLGGGSLLDIGIYTIYLGLLVLGIPTDITATAQLTETGLDSFCAMEFHYDNGAKANLESTIVADTPTEAFLHGTTGTLKLHRQFHHTEKITHTHNDEVTILDIKYKGNGYIHEIEKVNSCFLNRDIESSKLPLQMSLDLSVVMGTIKNKIGLKYDSQRTPFLNK